MVLPEIRLLETAVVLAEELNFSRAAEILHIDQSAVSIRIKDLEDQVGYLLFKRNHKTVELTEAGRKFVEEARVALLHVERAVQSGRAASLDAEVVLNIGRSPYTDPFLVTTLFSIKLPLFPQLKIELSQQFSCDLIRDVLAGALDLAIATEPPDSKRLTMVKVAESPFYIAMAKEDELASEPSVTLDALAGRPWVLFERRLHPPVYDSVMRLARERNIAVTKVQHIVVPEDAYPLIADGGAVAFVVKSGAIRIAREGLTVRPLAEDSLILRTYFASRADEKSRVVSELVRAFMRKIETFTKVSRVPVACLGLRVDSRGASVA
jgi:DNA-binding transcriptional LysR family regulator